MFTFADTPVKFVGLLAFLAWCTVWSSYELTRLQDVRQRISNVLHLLMALVMLVMVTPSSWNALAAAVPTFVLVGVFALSVAWFGWLSIEARRGSDRRGALHFFGHAAMFGAMTWHLSAMAVMAAARSGGTGMGPSPDMGGMDRGPGSGGMDMGQWMTAQRMPGGTLWIFALIGIPFMAYLLASSLYSLWQALQSRDPSAELPCPCGPGCSCGPECSCSRGHVAVPEQELQLVASGGTAAVRKVAAPVLVAHSCHEVRPIGTTRYRLESLAAFSMNFGMFWMSTGLLVPLLPFFALFAF